MITVKVTGGLGNQMFQYAAGLALARKNGVELAIDPSEYAAYKLHDFELNQLRISAKILPLVKDQLPPVFSRLVRKLKKRLWGDEGIYEEPSLRWDPKFFNLGSDVTVQGYFQSERYFADVSPELKTEFLPKMALKPEHQYLAQQMQRTPSVMLHVRRGNYVSNQQTLKIHGVCSPEYYRRALEWMESQLEVRPQCYVFSNDMAWVQRELSLPPETVYVQGNENNPVGELQLMSSCRHHVIANSTFSWWAAWLGQSQGQCVVAPTPWFDATHIDSTDLLPSHWHLINK